jgi:hypothetical protein
MSAERSSLRVRLAVAAAVILPAGMAAAVVSAAPAGAATVRHSVGSATVRHISAGGSTRLSTKGATGTGAAGAVQSPEFPAPVGGDDAAGDGGADRSHSSGGGSTPVGAVAQPSVVTASHPGLLTSFSGLDHFDQRFGSTAGANQFSLEPPDQGLCVGSDGSGNTRVLEVVNDVLRVYTTSGTAVTPATALNDFFGYAPAIVRSPLTFGPFLTDPSCLYDAGTGHWFLVILTLDSYPQVGDDGLQHYTGTNHIDIAVSRTSDPAGAWTIYHLPVQDDGTQGTPNHHCSPGDDTSPPSPPLPTNPTACFGDYPHIGADANGFYVTTNEYSFFGPEFHGAQVYAMSKTQLASGSPSLTVVQFDTHGADTFGFGSNGFTLWPSTTPGGSGDPSAGGTEYFMSSNAAAEARDPGDGSSTSATSHQLLVWALTNTSSLDTSPALALSATELNVNPYAPPPKSTQKAGPQPLRECLNNNPCSLVLEGLKDPYAEKSAALDSNDSRMQQVTWVNGKLWGALDTSLSVTSATQAGVEWFEAAPSTATGSVSATLANQGYLGLGNDNLTYPALGVTSSGTGVMAFTVVGSDYYPSAGYAPVTSAGVGPVHIAAAGAGPEDGFSNYKLFGDPPGTVRERWGDYGAAVPVGSTVWIASEFIGQSCTLSTYEQTNFRCGDTRTALANWSTRVSQVAAP